MGDDDFDVDLNVALGLEDSHSESDVVGEQHSVEKESFIDIDTEDIEINDSDRVYCDNKDSKQRKDANFPNKGNENLHNYEDESVKVERDNVSDEKQFSPKNIKKEEVGDDEEEEMDASNTDKKVESTILEELEKLINNGALFDDLEKVYLIYCEYARFKGFSVRKGEQRYFGRRGDIRWKEFICSCSGRPNYTSVKHRLALYKKLVTRTDCKARLIVSRDDLGAFGVTLFEKDHNHVLLPCDQTYLLRSSRNLSYAKKSLLEALNSAGVGITTAYKFMEKESGGVQNVGFTKKDAFHHIDGVRMETKVEDGDAKLLFEYFTNKGNADPFFFWKYQLDDDGRLMNIFFRDARCAVDYDAFGDVLSVDTTYRTNKYNLICAPFVGMNHHTSNVMFGMALMSDETTVSFKWLFEMFLESMHGKEPKVIFTDQCRAMMNAIDVVFPNSKHRLCQWHISKNCASNFGKLNGNISFKRLWYKCMNVVETDGEFQKTWKEMMENYEIVNQSWYDGMWNLRERWSSAYSRGIFTGGLLATSRSELTNKVLKDVVRCTVALIVFVRQYEDILTTWRTKERNEDTYNLFTPGQVITNSGLLAKAARVFTRTIYKQFEYDLANCVVVVVDRNCLDLSNNNFQYTARSRDLLSVERKVVFNTETKCATCDCGKWETEGLICQHILKVFVIENVNDIPDSMIFLRWTKRAKHLNHLEPEIVGEDSSTLRHMTFANQFMRHMYEMVSSAMQHEQLRPKLLQRMKEMDEEVAEIILASGSSEPLERKTPLVVPLFRNPRKVAPRGFANVRNSTPFASKGRKRGPKSSQANNGANGKKKPKASPKSKKAKNEEEAKEENGADPNQNFEDMDKFWNLSL